MKHILKQCWDPSLHQPEWIILLFLTAIAGYLFPLGISFMGFLQRRRVHSAIEGKWHSYHFTFLDGKPCTVHSQISVEKGMKSPYVSYLLQDVESKLSYKAKITKEKGHLLFVYTSRQHDETVINRFPDPLGQHRSKLYGLWLSYDHSQVIASGAILLSRDEISVDKVDSIITRGYEIPAGRRPLARIKNL